MKNFMSLINSQTSLEEAFSILAAIEKAAETTEAETGLEDQGDNLATLRIKLKEIQQDYALLNSLVEKIFEENGRQNLTKIKQVATIAAKDYRSAYDLTTFYTKEWFSRLFMSIDDKIDFAAHLLSIVTPFGVQNTDCWSLLVDNNPEMLNYVSVPHTDT